MTSFSNDHLRSVLDDVETYLGYLKGNELADRYIWEQMSYFGNHDQSPGPETYLLNLDDYGGLYHFPCPEDYYRVRPRVHTFTIAYDPHTVSRTGDPFAGLAHQIRSQIDQSWRNGASWASGLGDYLYSFCAQFSEPSVDTLASTITDMERDVVAALNVGARDDWAKIGALLGDWHGESAYSFDTFYANYNDTLAQFAVLNGYVLLGFAAATKIINGVQHGVTKYAESARSAVLDQLDGWRVAGEQPVDTPKDPAWIAKVAQIASDAYSLLDHVPVVSDIKAEVDNVTSIMDTVVTVAGDLGLDTEPPHEQRPFKARTADELYADVTGTLNDDYYTPYTTAMDRLYSGTGAVDVDNASQAPFSGVAVENLVASIKSRYDWGLPPVPADSLHATGDRY